MDLKLGILLLPVLINTAASLTTLNVSSEVYQRDCKLMFTYGYGYNKYFHISKTGSHKGKNLTIRFLVRARSDAHVLLSSVSSPPEGLPVYEIVLGAGKNTFSDIRRLRRSSTKATVATNDLLSNIELRGFWIHVNTKGLIQVGKEGEDAPFLFWTDPLPLNVNYFSFCTWTGVVGKWLYDCPIANDTEQIEVVEEKPTTMTQKLRKDLLTDYDPYSLPLLQQNHRIAVFMHLSYHHVNLDVKRSIFSIDGTLPMQWRDEKVKWKPEDYGGLSDVNINEHEVWIPEVVLYNAVGHGANILGRAGMTITSQGTVMWSPPTRLEVWCDVNVGQWPRDEHTCELQLGFWTQREFLELLMMENETMMENEMMTGSEWEVVKIETETVITTAPWIEDVDSYDYDSSADSLTIRITVRRKSEPYTTILVTPLVIISMLMMLSFWLPPQSSGKIGIICVSLVLLALFIVNIGNTLPAPADYVPILVLLYSWYMIAGVLIILSATYVTCLTRYIHKTSPPSLLCVFVNHQITQVLLFLPKVTKESGKTYNQLEETGDASGSRPDTSTQTNTPTHEEVQQYWIVLGIVIDRISCLFYLVFLIATLIKYN